MEHRVSTSGHFSVVITRVDAAMRQTLKWLNRTTLSVTITFATLGVSVQILSGMAILNVVVIQTAVLLTLDRGSTQHCHLPPLATLK